VTGRGLSSPKGASPVDLVLVGAGKMGRALLQGWVDDGLIGRVAVIEPAGLPDFDRADLAGDRRLLIMAEPSALPPDFHPQVLVLAVKPQVMAAAAPLYRDYVAAGALVLSIAAGQTLAGFARHYGHAAAIVRSMPNTPAAIGCGITVACANARVAPAQQGLADRLLAAVGAVEWVEDEMLLDAVTALSGGGPAYVFLLIEALAEAGAKAGLPADLAMRLARATIAGAGELARRSSESAAQLRANVTSPKGTTLAALEVLMAADGIQPLFDRALAAATRRSRELAG
jgi:pyrroline-5-carboxylate reductase